MAFNGSGTFSRTDGTRTGSTTWTQARDGAVKINASDHDTHDQDIANGLTNCITKDGQTTPTANIPFGGYKATNVGSGTARTDASNVGSIQDSAYLYGGTSGGSANAQTLTLAPAITTYITGQTFLFKAGYTNTSAPTINVNGVGAKSIKKLVGGGKYDVLNNEIIANKMYAIIYDGTDFLLLNASDVFWRSTSTAAVSNTASETDQISLTVAANTLNSHGKLYFVWFGFMRNDTGASRTAQFKVKLGSTTLFDSGSLTVLDGGAAVDTALMIESWISASASTSSQQAFTRLTLDVGSPNNTNGVANATSEIPIKFASDNAAEDATTALTLKVTTQLGTASTSLYVQNQPMSFAKLT